MVWILNLKKKKKNKLKKKYIYIYIYIYICIFFFFSKKKKQNIFTYKVESVESILGTERACVCLCEGGGMF